MVFGGLGFWGLWKLSRVWGSKNVSFEFYAFARESRAHSFCLCSQAQAPYTSSFHLGLTV